MHSIHNGANAFRCIFCPKIFKSKFNLNNHINIHCGKRPFTCELCGATFQKKPHIERHKISRHNVKCPIVACNFVIPNAADLKAHYEQYHPDQSPPPAPNLNFKCVLERRPCA